MRVNWVTERAEAGTYLVIVPAILLEVP